MQKSLWPAALAFAAELTLASPAAQAFTIASLPTPPANEVIAVRDFCGLGWHRGPYGACHPNGVVPYVYRPYAAYGAPYPGRCWWRNTVYGPRRVCTW